MCHVVTETSIGEFAQKLVDEEKSKATVEKYSASLKKLMVWLDGRELSHELLAEYRDFLVTDHAATSVNGSISAINKYLDVAGLSGYKLVTDSLSCP